jgi:hypothetical protein
MQFSGKSFTPSPAGFVCLEFSWLHAPFLFSSIQPYLPVAIAVFSFIIYSLCEGVLSPTLQCSMLHSSHCCKLSPLQAYWGRCCHSCLLPLVCLFTVQVGSAPFWNSGCPAHFATCLFCFILFYFLFSCLFIIQFVFSLFSLGGGQSVQRAMLIYHVPHSSPGGLSFPSSLGAGVRLHGIPPGFSI